jgi:hypothetical protein
MPACGEGNTEEEALADLRGALRAYFEAFGLDCALARPSINVNLDPAAPSRKARHFGYSDYSRGGRRTAL